LIFFFKDPSGTVTDANGLQMRRGLRHRLYAMAACGGMDAAQRSGRVSHHLQTDGSRGPF
jgi:hypothetical protein